MFPGQRGRARPPPFPMKKSAPHLLKGEIESPVFDPFGTAHTWSGFGHAVDAPLPSVLLMRSRDVAIAATESLVRQRAGGSFDALETRRRAQPEFEAAAVYALHFPAPALQSSHPKFKGRF